jgi:peptide/nickel transport system permease protein
VRATLARAAALLVVLLLAGVGLQVAVSLAPGDAVDLAGVGADQRAALVEAWGLDGAPLPRALRAVGRALRGDLGTSLVVRPGAPVGSLVLVAWARSLPLLLGGVLLGPLLGAVVARAPRAVAGTARVLAAGPVFLAAALLVAGLNEAAFAGLGAGLPRPGWFPLPDRVSVLRGALAVGLVAWSGGALGDLSARTRDRLAAIRRAPWLLAARSRGEPTGDLALRALAPALAGQAAARAVGCAGALVIVEKMLLVRGAGALLWDAALARDLPLVAGLAWGAAVVVGVLRLGFDALQVAADPRLADAT